ncbi:tetratricopeptide repeat protein [Paenibacillus thermotolerans]|uniref:tetratricopeptide repeat protein n=1 Tax=Paenibacillus thermotolerans TaxID=3027807 RepID=UPI0023681394|nr:MULTISPECIES: tetratricopeptide repeat protein [unclassified Paenibacillus]
MGGERELQKAYEHILMQHFEGAVEWFLKAIEQDPDNPDYHYKLSITYARSNKISEALKHARTAKRLSPGQSEYDVHLRMLEAKELVLQAERHLNRGKDGCLLAAALLRQALTLNPVDENAYMLMAGAFAGVEDYREAIQTLQELLRLDPEHKAAKELLDQYKIKLAAYLEEYG